MKTNTQLQKNIMRRVYYAFGIKVLTHTVTMHVVVLALLGYALAHLVHVARIYDRVAGAEFSELGTVVFRMVTNADVLTLTVLGVAIFTALSLRISVRTISFPSLQAA